MSQAPEANKLARDHQPARDGAGFADADIVDRLREARQSMSAGQGQIADLALADPAGVAALTIWELAAAAETSIGTVQRLCRLIGVKGYTQFRVGLSAAAGKELAQAQGRAVVHTITADDNIRTIIDKVTSAEVRAVSQTAQSLDEEAITAAVTAMSSARRIDIYGVGSSGSVGLDFQHKLHRIGRTAFAWQDQDMALASAALLSADDVALGISHTGTTKDTLEAVQQAKAAGATTIALTNFARSSLAEAADIVLKTATRDTTFRSDAMSSRIAQLTVIDILFVAIAQRHYDSSLSSLKRVRSAMAIRHLPSRGTR